MDLQRRVMRFGLLHLDFADHLLMLLRCGGSARLRRLEKRHSWLHRAGHLGRDWLTLICLKFVDSFFEVINAVEQLLHGGLV